MDDAERSTRGRMHGAARAVLTGCGCPRCLAAQALLEEGSSVAERGTAADEQPLARALAAGLSDTTMRLVALDAGVQALAATMDMSLRRIADEVGGLGRRVDALERQPQPGGPAARAVEKASPFATRGLPGASTTSASDQLRALESLAGQIRDPQVQVAIASELIRLQQTNQANGQ